MRIRQSPPVCGAKGVGVDAEHRHVGRAASSSGSLEKVWFRAPHGGTRRPGCLSTYIADGLLIGTPARLPPPRRQAPDSQLVQLLKRAAIWRTSMAPERVSSMRSPTSSAFAVTVRPQRFRNPYATERAKISLE